MEKVFLGLGGNVGNKANNLQITCLSIENEIGRITAKSSVYETRAWGFHSPDWFWNMVVEVETLLSPAAILEKIASIENSLGRKRTQPGYISRTVDIDLLYYGNRIVETAKLTIPHPRLEKRKFVLVPLAEIAPDFVHPKVGLSTLDLLKNCPDISEIRKIE